MRSETGEAHRNEGPQEGIDEAISRQAVKQIGRLVSSEAAEDRHGRARSHAGTEGSNIRPRSSDVANHYGREAAKLAKAEEQ